MIELAANVLLADVVRFAAMFSLGAAVSIEVTTVRYAHVAIWLPHKKVRLVPMSALVLFGVSRVAGLIFIAYVLHDHFGQPLHWYTPAAAFIGVTSFMASAIVSRTTL